MNQFEMVFGIVLIVMIASVIRSIFGGGRRGLRHNRDQGADHPADDRLIEEIRALRSEIKALKERQAVIERITVEKESSLEREIERLRDQ